VPLTDTQIKNIKPTPGAVGRKYSDGHGLYLHVKDAGKYWRMAYRFNGKQKVLALGVYPLVTLAKARVLREEARVQLAEGRDPNDVKREDKAAQALAAESTFELFARDWLKRKAVTQAPTTHAKITTWLEKDVFPHIGAMPIIKIGPRDVLSALRKMEDRGAHDSAIRVKQICGQIFRAAVASGHADRDVTADLQGALTLPKRKHFAAITRPEEVRALLLAIEQYHGHVHTRAALKFAPLVFVRPGELRHAEWAEIDLEAAQWTIPAARMKMGVEHLVPLSTQALTILRQQHQVTGSGKYVFPSIRTGERPMSENTINAALRGLGFDGDTHTGHGFRAMARTILDEELGFRPDFIEHQLAHAVKDPNGRAYNRTSHLAARIDMMQKWADYLDGLRAGGGGLRTSLK
jgi:integrase